MLKLVLLPVVLSLVSASLAFAGANTSGGGSPDTVRAGALKLLLEGGGLKKAMLNYIDTLSISEVEDPLVRNQLLKMMKQSALPEDIKYSNYVLATKKAPFRDAYDSTVPASTTVGRPRSNICFDVEKLQHSFKGLSEEDVMVQLAALAFHEHTHHFQVFSSEAIQQNESEANRVSGYILITAKFVQLPLLRWTKPDSGPAEFQTIQTMYAAIRAKEQAFIAPDASDYSNYPGYQGQKDRGVVRLLPNETYDGKLSINGGGSYFSFTRLTHEYGQGSDIALRNKSLTANDFAGCNFGFFGKLGDISLDLVTEQNSTIQLLMNYNPANHDEPSARKQQDEISNNNLMMNGINFPARIGKFHVGETFGLRSVQFDRTDTLIAIQVVRIDKDGSVILAWKKLMSFQVPSCN